MADSKQNDWKCDGEAKPRKRAQFQVMPRPKEVKVPRVSDLHVGQSCATKPPDEVLQLLGNDRLVVGVDIETHDWETNAGSKGGFGQFGFYTRCDSNDYAARIVEIGWAVSDGDAAMVVKERLVKPDGFRVSDKAAKFHGISHDLASSEGLCLRDVLREFMDDMIDIYQRDGRIVVHHLEFDAGIVAREFERAGLAHLQEPWDHIARGGICTMDPSVGKWMREYLGMELASYHSGNTMRLNDMLKIVPESAQLIHKRHSAGVDAHLHVLLYRALVKLAAASDGRADSS